MGETIIDTMPRDIVAEWEKSQKQEKQPNTCEECFFFCNDPYLENPCEGYCWDPISYKKAGSIVEMSMEACGDFLNINWLTMGKATVGQWFIMAMQKARRRVPYL